jgi:hypothetical protein
MMRVMEQRIIDSAIDIFQPVMELSVYYAAMYAKACSRNTVTGHDMQYGMRHATRTCVGKHSGSLFPDAYDSHSETESSEEEYEEEEDEFTRYTGDDPEVLAMNISYDTWDAWVPEIPAEIMIKNAIDEKGKV